MVNICVDARPLASGHRLRGIGTYVSALIEHLGRGEAQGIELRYLWPSDRMDALKTAPAVVQNSASRLDVVGGNVAALLKAAGCRIYHATALESLAPSNTYATVATLYDLIPLRMPRWRHIVRRPNAYFAYRRQLRTLAQADHVIAISQATKHDACELLGIAPERISVVPLAADPARAYVPSAADMDEAVAALGLEQPYFLGVASSDPHKNILLLLAAFAAFCGRHQQGISYRLYIVGAWMGHEERRLHDQIARLGLDGKVRHLTSVPTHAMAAIYHGATALVFPSLMEGFGLPVLEAMLCETPVVTSDRSSLPEVSGDAALLVNPEDTDGLAAALLRLAEDSALRLDLIARGRLRSRQFSWDRVASETMAIYQHMAGISEQDSSRAATN